MTYDEFIVLVRDMRRAQRKYFSERSQEWLHKAKKLEREVDIACLSDTPAQGKLFDSSKQDLTDE